MNIKWVSWIRKRRKPDIPPETTYIIYNRGTEYQFGECSQCGFEDLDQLFINMMILGGETFGACPACKARIKRALLAEEIG